MAASAAVIWAASVRLRPRSEHVEIMVPTIAYAAHEELRDVRTPDGKIIKAFVAVEEPKIVEVKPSEEVTREPTPEERLRLWFLIGAGALIFLFTLGIIVLVQREQEFGLRGSSDGLGTTTLSL